ncbi:F0F1 ATP synthase subunit epsilon [Thermodesulfobacteriota bacterium]
MRLRIFLPSEIFVDIGVVKVVGESPAGSFTILPRHIDIATALVPSILAYYPGSRQEFFLAVNGGILVKQGDDVSVATRMAIKGELGVLRDTVEKIINEVDERERKTRTAVAKLEADIVRRFVEFGKNA